MNIIQIFLLIAIWFMTVMKGKSYFELRDEYIRSGEQDLPEECKNSKKVFINSLVIAVIYTLIKIL